MSLVDQINFWKKSKGSSLSTFEQVVVARPFKYSSYWHRWSRVLKPVYGGNPHGYVEFSIEPVVPGWDKPGDPSPALVKSITEAHSILIRHHSTIPDKKDVYASQPPDEVIACMRRYFGDEDTQYMLYGNILSTIDWDRYSRVKTLGGGIPLAACSLT